MDIFIFDNYDSIFYAHIYHCVKIMIVVNLFKNNTIIFFHCFNVKIVFSSKKSFLKTHNMAWNIQIAEICSVCHFLPSCSLCV